MWLDSRFTQSERRGLLLVVILLMGIVGLVWCFSGVAQPGISQVATMGVDTVVTADTVSAVRTRVSRSNKKTHASKPMEPRRSPLDERVPVTR